VSLAESDVLTCRLCGLAVLEGYPHRHETPPRPDYDPMPPRPLVLACEQIDLTAYWTDTFDPSCCMVHTVRAEYNAEIPRVVHVHDVPNHTEPIPIRSGDPDGPTMQVTDSGPLGGISWARSFERRMAIIVMLGETSLQDGDYAIYPWAQSINGIRGWCAGRHRSWYEHAGQPLCWTLVRHVIEGGYRIDRAGELEGIPPEQARNLVAQSLSRVWTWTSNALNDIDLRPSPRRRVDSMAAAAV
jgi:hypothetical protein